ncbi:MAG: MarR family winged helix-turn-helix transcriptional regulator [Candidatus Coproplasma sp.]
MNRQHIGYMIKSINDKLKTKADEDLKTHSLTMSQSRVVWFLTEKGGTATQKEIEDELSVSHPTVVGLVSRMEQNGIVRTYFDDNSRSKAVSLTPHAVSLARDMDEMINERERKMLAGLSEEEIATLKRALTAVLQNLEK